MSALQEWVKRAPLSAIDRVARAIRAAHYKAHERQRLMEPWSSISESRKDAWRPLAAAALKSAVELLDARR